MRLLQWVDVSDGNEHSCLPDAQSGGARVLDQQAAEPPLHPSTAWTHLSLLLKTFTWNSPRTEETQHRAAASDPMPQWGGIHLGQREVQQRVLRCTRPSGRPLVKGSEFLEVTAGAIWFGSKSSALSTGLSTLLETLTSSKQVNPKCISLPTPNPQALG